MFVYIWRCGDQCNCIQATVSYRKEGQLKTLVASDHHSEPTQGHLRGIAAWVEDQARRYQLELSDDTRSFVTFFKKV